MKEGEKEGQGEGATAAAFAPGQIVWFICGGLVFKGRYEALSLGFHVVISIIELTDGKEMDGTERYPQTVYTSERTAATMLVEQLRSGLELARYRLKRLKATSPRRAKA
jgi:hypothetical protein